MAELTVFNTYVIASDVCPTVPIYYGYLNGSYVTMFTGCGSYSGLLYYYQGSIYQLASTPMLASWYVYDHLAYVIAALASPPGVLVVYTLNASYGVYQMPSPVLQVTVSWCPSGPVAYALDSSGAVWYSYPPYSSWAIASTYTSVTQLLPQPGCGYATVTGSGASTQFLGSTYPGWAVISYDPLGSMHVVTSTSVDNVYPPVFTSPPQYFGALPMYAYFASGTTVMLVSSASPPLLIGLASSLCAPIVAAPNALVYCGASGQYYYLLVSEASGVSVSPSYTVTNRNPFPGQLNVSYAGTIIDAWGILGNVAVGTGYIVQSPGAYALSAQAASVAIV